MVTNTEKTTTESNGVYTKKINKAYKAMEHEDKSIDYIKGFTAGLKFTAEIMMSIK